MTEQKLDQLFDSARNAELQTTSEEVTRWLATAAVATAAAGAAATGFKLFLTKNMIAMIVGTLSVAGIAVVASGVFSEDVNKPVQEQSQVVMYADSNTENTESETTYYARPLVLDEVTSNEPEQAATELEMPVMDVKFANTEAPVRTIDQAAGREDADGLRTVGRKDTAETPLNSYELQVSSFSSLQLDGIFDVIIEQGAEESVVVEGGTVDQVVAEMDGQTLLLFSSNSCDRNNRGNEKTPVVRVTVKKISQLTIHAIGNVEVVNLKVPRLTVDFDGVGDLKLNVTSETFELNTSGIGNISLSGAAGVANLDYSGVGDVNAFEFLVHRLVAIGTGVGNMYLFADEELSIDGSGVGDIRYKGGAAIQSLNFSGIGTLKHE